MCFSVLPTIYTSQTQETAPTYHLSLYYRSLSTISTTDRKRRQRERPRLPTQKSSSRSSAFHSAASPADLLTFQPRSMRPRRSPSRPSVPRSPSITRRAPTTQRRFMPSMLSRRWHIFPPKKPVFEGWAACASGEWSSYQFRRDLDAPLSLPPPSSGNLTDARVVACYPSGSHGDTGSLPQAASGCRGPARWAGATAW